MRNKISHYANRPPIAATAIILLCLIGTPRMFAATPVQGADRGTKTALETRLAELDRDVRATREELAQSREEIRQLRLMLQTLEQHLARRDQLHQPAPENTQAATEPPARVNDLPEEHDIFRSQLEQLEQAKVESASKYPVRLTGLLLANAFFNRGNTDNIDVPALALSPSSSGSNGAIGATFRQSILGLEATGPTVLGAKSSANIFGDFFGGFPNAHFGVTAGLLRLRTARISLDWRNTSVIAGQEAPFFSPLSPTSLATFGEPALSWAGNLWTWTPQIRAEHTLRLSHTHSFLVQAGLLDPIDPDLPSAQSLRRTSRGEQARQPGYATRVSWTRQTLEDHPMTIGLGGFFSPQNYSPDRRVSAWAGTADWKIPFARVLELSGELYRGQAVGGLGGAQFVSLVASGDLQQPSGRLRGLNSVGIWGQLKYRPSSRLEFNTALGHDNPFASEVERFAALNPPAFARNQTSFLNVIFTPKSNVILSLEYRHIQSYSKLGKQNTAEHLNLAAGYSF